VPIHVWAREAPAEAVRQLERLAALPFVVGHVAGMADLHASGRLAVGSVFATRHELVAAALGDDLGCGVRALRLSGALEPDQREAVLAAWSARIPVGDAPRKTRLQQAPTVSCSTRRLEHEVRAAASRHLGTLGGGNHFVELDQDAAGTLWLLVHSGSRGVGGVIARHLGAAPIDVRNDAGAEAQLLLSFASDFARSNRAHLMETALDVLTEHLGPQTAAPIDTEHNFVARELHGDEALLIHRKGAIAAPRGSLAVIPGSMGTASYVVEGLGAPASFCSASHGAGRVMTRGEARRRISPALLRHRLRRVTFDVSRVAQLVEEAPDAYRDIRDVMEDQADLVTPLVRLEPVLVLKG
jgi:tRNA-splicing ligase RtcB